VTILQQLIAGHNSDRKTRECNNKVLVSRAPRAERLFLFEFGDPLREPRHFSL
jgi:hypothetical protein